jgi:hypothetical protein
MDKEDQDGALQLNLRLRGVSPPVTRRSLIGEQALLVDLIDFEDDVDVVGGPPGLGIDHDIAKRARHLLLAVFRR